MATDLDLSRFVVAKPLDHAACWVGVWWGAWKARSWAALVPRVNPRCYAWFELRADWRRMHYMKRPPEISATVPVM